MTRALISVALTMGWYFCASRILDAVILASGYELADLANEIPLLIAQQVLQLLAGLAGCIVVGAGNRSAILYGAMAGVINGIIFMFIQSTQQAAENTLVSYYSQPLLHLTFGMFGSILGAWLWQPLPTLVPLPGSSMTDSPIDTHRKQNLILGFGFSGFSWEVQWFRVLVGTAIAVAGVMSADSVLRLVRTSPIPTIKEPVAMKAKQRVFTLEVAALAIFVGGAVAGASTWNGGVQGLCVGGMTAVIIVGYQMAGGGSDFVSAEWNPVLQVLGVAGLGTAGGWMASVILPPVFASRQPKFRGLHY